MSLSAASISELTTISAPMEIVREWLASFFDGSSHDVGLHASVSFPAVDLRFAIGRDPQPLATATPAGVSLRTVMVPQGPPRRCWNQNTLNGVHLRVEAPVLFQFWIKARLDGEGQGEYAALSVAEKLGALLGNPDPRYLLAERGIHCARPEPPEPVPGDGCALYLVSCPAELHYPVLVTESLAAGDASDPGAQAAREAQSVSFTREAPLIEGSYLLGGALWRGAMALRSVEVRGVGGSGDTVLELEVDGVLTGVQVTLPGGNLVAETSGTNAAPGYTVAAESLCRWRVVTALAAAEQCAIQVTLVLACGVA